MPEPMTEFILTICGPSRGRYGAPWRIDGPRGVRKWITERYRPAKAPRTVRCSDPRHFFIVRGNRRWYRREGCYVQKWRLTKREFKAAVDAFDMFSLDMPPRFLCPTCARAERGKRRVQ